ncbi:MAG: alpha-amylase family glycosyl hydrolase [Bacteroidota bacterium]
MKRAAASMLLALVLITIARTQIITADPAFPTDSQPVTIYFDATKGTQGLIDYPGDVYAHTGVLTDKSSGGGDWKYVKTNWGENTPETKLTRESANLYSLQITPSIREYYGVPGGESITHLTFVFRSEDSSKEGKGDGATDIFYEVYEEGLQVTITYPERGMLVLNLNEVVDFEAVATLADTMAIYINGEHRKSRGGVDVITDTLPTEAYGEFEVVVWAANQEDEARDTMHYIVRSEPVIEEVPDGIMDGINYLSETVVILSLYAPGKEYVYVVGDFSGWAPRENFYMKKSADGTRFWLQIDGLSPGVEYAYQYFIDGELLLADPYTEKVLDPGNDGGISETTYPNLKEYPHGQTIGIASVLQTGQQDYSWENTSFTPPEKSKLVIYEMLLRDFLVAHDWTTLTDTLDYFSNLGVNAIELLPFNEFEGNESWGYNPSFYFAPDKYYGPKEELQVFIDSCHGRGIAVIMDMVLNHSYSQSPFVQLYFDPSTYKVTAENPWYNVESPNSAYSWGYDFDHESQATKELVDRVNTHWLSEYALDGFRFDFTKGFTNTPGDGGAYDAARIAILKRMADEIWKVKSDAWVILEHFSDNSEERDLANYGMMIWGNTNHNYGEGVMGYNENGKSNFSWISYKNRGWNDPHLVGYMESHDEERLMYKMLTYGKVGENYSTQDPNTALERMKLAGAFFFTIPGPKMVWQFGELGYDYSIDYDCRVCNKPIRWDYYDVWKRNKLYQVWSSLIRLKTNEQAFSSTDFTLNVTGAAKRISINHEDMDVRIIGNFDVVEQSMDPSFSKAGWWYDYFGRDSSDVANLNEPILLQPGEFRIYTTKRLGDPGIADGIQKLRQVGNGFRTYPNPVRDMLYMDPVNQEARIRVFNISGKLVMEDDLPVGHSSLDLSTLPDGIFIITRLAWGRAPQFAKIVKVSP